MSKIYVQGTLPVFSLSGSLPAAASIAGSALISGYSTLVGGFRSDVVTETGSGFRIEQSLDRGATWDIVSASCLVSASAASSFSVDIRGDAIRVFVRNGATAASTIRSVFYARPI